ncbi:MAG: hypothetical protein ACYC5Y_14140 [Symbiobacteriia bacterium]
MFTSLVLLLGRVLSAVTWFWWLAGVMLLVAAVWWWYTASTPVRSRPNQEAEDDDLST